VIGPGDGRDPRSYICLCMPDVQALFREYLRLDRRRRNDALSRRELARWSELKRRLNSTFSPGTSPELDDRRESVRVPANLRVQFGSAGELKACLLTNLSRGGVFLATPAPEPIGTQLRLKIIVQDPPAQIEVGGEVVSHNVGPGFDTHMTGMGVRFIDPDAAARTALGTLYERALDPSAKP
jgi:uncharacterized protein (TIGR02266 family)